MKISLALCGSADQVSGGYLYDRMMADRLRRSGAEVEILSLRPGSYLSCLADNFFSDLPGTLQKRRPDVLLQDELCHPSLFHLNPRLKKALGCPLISIVHHLRTLEPHTERLLRLYRRVERRYLETADGFIFNSKTTRAAVESLLGVERPSVVAYPGGDHVRPAVTDAEIRERSREPRALRILFIGNVIPRKGLHTLVAALGGLRRENWRLTVAGSLAADIPYTARIRSLIAGAGIEGQVALIGSIDDARRADLLETSHCLPVPSFYEGFGIVYLEAMAHGLPVLASTAGAVPEVIADGIEGFLVAPGDATALAACIDRFIHDRDLLAVMGAAAKKRYAEHPSWAAGAARIHVFLREMVARKRRET